MALLRTISLPSNRALDAVDPSIATHLWVWRRATALQTRGLTPDARDEI